MSLHFWGEKTVQSKYHSHCSRTISNTSDDKVQIKGKMCNKTWITKGIFRKDLLENRLDERAECINHRQKHTEVLLDWKKTNKQLVWPQLHKDRIILYQMVRLNTIFFWKRQRKRNIVNKQKHKSNSSLINTKPK